MTFLERVILSNYPDRGYIPLIAATYAYTLPQYILYINGSTISEFPSDEWINNTLYKMQKNDTQIAFGCQTMYHNEKVGCGLAIIQTSVVNELLFYTNSSSQSIPPLLALSLYSNMHPDEIQTIYAPFQGIKPNINYNYVDSTYQPIRSQRCPPHNETYNDTFAILLPQFKRDYIYNFSKKFQLQSVQPEFYCIVQCENRIHYDLTTIQNILRRKVYQIWCYNWSPLFYFPNHITSIFPVDFVIRYDDDMYSNSTNTHYEVIKKSKNDDVIIGNEYFILNINLCGYDGKINCKDFDHVTSPYVYRPFHAKLSCRLKHYTFAGGEDIGLCVSSNLLCNTKHSVYPFDIIAFHQDRKGHIEDESIKRAYIEENINGILLFKIYCNYVDGGYKPKCYNGYTTPIKKRKNLVHDHYKMNFI